MYEGVVIYNLMMNHNNCQKTFMTTIKWFYKPLICIVLISHHLELNLFFFLETINIDLITKQEVDVEKLQQRDYLNIKVRFMP